jgi:sugar phosphate isomerase/epimerase
MKRRTFIKVGAVAFGASALPFNVVMAASKPIKEPKELFKISLAEWSLNRTLRAGKMTNLDFARVAKRDFKIDCIEFVDQFFADKAKDKAYLAELKKRAEGEGVEMGLIMIDTTGDLGAADDAKRNANVEKTFAWIDAAAYLGCQTVRINARGPGSGDELRARIVESGSKLADHAAPQKINIAIENHGGLSSDPDWLMKTFREINKPNFGSLPDFGNFPNNIDRYDAVEAMMPFAKAVSAKAMKFGPDGECVETDYRRMMRIVRDHGYHGYVGVESSPGSEAEEADAIRKTRDLLLKVREEQSRVRPIFNGENLDGWTKIEGGDWIIEDGVLIGKNGKNWSTNPEKTGSWLSTKKQYSNFRLELQYTLEPRSNSGVFFRSSHQKNPAFTGYEMQIHDSPGRPPSKGGPSSIYDLVTPTKNLVRPAGQWNTVTIVAKGPQITFWMNGEKVLETEQTRSMKGYIGLQNHDEKSVVKFKNIRLQEL